MKNNLDVIVTGGAYAGLTSSAKHVAQKLAARYLAAMILPDCDSGALCAAEMLADIHPAMVRDCTQSYFDHTGGGIFLSYTFHHDAPSGVTLFASAGDESLRVYILPAELPEPASVDACAYMIQELCGEDEYLLALQINPYDGRAGEVSAPFRVYAAAGNLTLAAELLERESLRIYSQPLDSEQRDALRYPSESADMIDDMEARLSFDVGDARAANIRAHLLLQSVPLESANRIHELCLVLEYGETMSEFGVSEFNSADEMINALRDAGKEAVSEWCRRFIERWDDELSGVDAPYLCERLQRRCDTPETVPAAVYAVPAAPVATERKPAAWLESVAHTIATAAASAAYDNAENNFPDGGGALCDSASDAVYSATHAAIVKLIRSA